MRLPSNGFRDSLLYILSVLAAVGITGMVKMYADLSVAKATTASLENRVGGCENTATDLVRQLQEQWADLERIKSRHEQDDREREGRR